LHGRATHLTAETGGLGRGQEPAKAEAVSALVVRCRYGCRVRKVKGLSSQARQAGKTMIGEGGAAIPRHPSCVQLVKPVRCVLKTALSESS
jgi:hypothetical protein